MERRRIGANNATPASYASPRASQILVTTCRNTNLYAPIYIVSLGRRSTDPPVNAEENPPSKISPISDGLFDAWQAVRNVRITFMFLCWHPATGKKMLGSQVVMKLRGPIPGEQRASCEDERSRRKNLSRDCFIPFSFRNIFSRMICLAFLFLQSFLLVDK